MFQHGAVLSHRHCACPRALLSLLKTSFSPFISIVKDILLVEEVLQCGQLCHGRAGAGPWDSLGES